MKLFKPRKSIIRLVCVNCNEYFYTTRKKMYCGSQIEKKGCAYKRQLQQIRQWDKRNPIIIRKMWQKATEKFQKNNPEKFKQQCKKYYKKNREKIIKYRRLYYLEHKEKFKERNRISYRKKTSILTPA